MPLSKILTTQHLFIYSNKLILCLFLFCYISGAGADLTLVSRHPLTWYDLSFICLLCIITVQLYFSFTDSRLPMTRQKLTGTRLYGNQIFYEKIWWEHGMFWRQGSPHSPPPHPQEHIQDIETWHVQFHSFKCPSTPTLYLDLTHSRKVKTHWNEYGSILTRNSLRVQKIVASV